MKLKMSKSNRSDPEKTEQPPARGIALCLGMLADEAFDLGLPETALAIRHAIAACLIEASGREDLAGSHVH